MLRRLWEKLKLLWKLAKSERAAPREIGWAVAIGAFAGCTPAVGIHSWVALGLATLFRKNRLFAWLGSRISNMVMLPFIALAEVQVSHRLRTGEWMQIDRKHIFDHAPSLLLDLCLGTLPVGGSIAIVLGLAAYGLAHRRDARKQRAFASGEPADDADATVPALSDAAAAAATPAEATPEPPRELPPPSSGSPA